jgi:secondary thiamine-phosphate synthase enzyme
MNTLSRAEMVEISTHGKGTYEITDEVAAIVKKSGVITGTATVFVQHTSASLVIFENADPSARTDLNTFFARLVPDSESKGYIHTAEGSDDMTSHLRMALTRTSEVIPVVQGKLALGTWQGLFLFEHRHAPHHRHVQVVVLGTA